MIIILAFLIWQCGGAWTCSSRIYGCDFTGIIDRVFGYGLLSFIGPRLFADKLRKTKSEYAKSYNTVCSKINEMLHGTETLLTCGKHSFLFQKMQRVSDDNMQKDFDMKQTETVATIITSLITWIPGFVIMVAGAMLVVQGKIDGKLSDHSKWSFKFYYFSISANRKFLSVC